MVAAPPTGPEALPASEPLHFYTFMMFHSHPPCPEQSGGEGLSGLWSPLPRVPGVDGATTGRRLSGIVPHAGLMGHGCCHLFQLFSRGNPGDLRHPWHKASLAPDTGAPSPCPSLVLAVSENPSPGPGGDLPLFTKFVSNPGPWARRPRPARSGRLVRQGCLCTRSCDRSPGMVRGSPAGPAADAAWAASADWASPQGLTPARAQQH